MQRSCTSYSLVSYTSALGYPYRSITYVQQDFVLLKASRVVIDPKWANAVQKDTAFVVQSLPTPLCNACLPVSTIVRTCNAP